METEKPEFCHEAPIEGGARREEMGMKTKFGFITQIPAYDSPLLKGLAQMQREEERAADPPHPRRFTRGLNPAVAEAMLIQWSGGVHFFR